MTVEIEQILSPEGALARRLTGYEPRPQQAQMAEAVARTLAQRSRLAVEAGTGVGKSFAYLLPAIKRIIEHRERVIIATNTISLQEQLMDKDIPLLNAVIPDEFTAVLVKGRGNYVSLRRLRLASERQDRLFGDDDARHSLHAIEDWAYATRDGTLSTLPQLSRPEVWEFARSDADNCMGKKCPTYNQCFYQAARRRMENGDLLICNHALFFSDLALRSGGVGFLPKYDHVILDEAHGIEDVASDHFGVELTESSVARLMRLLYHPRSGRGFLASLALKDGGSEAISQAVELSQRCATSAELFFDALWRWQKHEGPTNGRVAGPNIIDNDLTSDLARLANHLKLLKERAAREADEFELNSYSVRAAALAESASVLLEQRLADSVYWVESTARRGSERGGDETLPAMRQAGRHDVRMSLHGMPIEVGPILRDKLFSQEVSVIMTSATLATARNDFTHFISRTGCDGADTLQLGSPFDHARQMRVWVDRTMPQPESREYVEAMCPRLLEHIRETDGGAFVLFTSFAMLDRVAERLRSTLIRQGFQVLAQGKDGPPGLLLRKFRDDDRSVLFGTSSFWQGVDVRGRALRNVIITRLPFDVPDRPLIQARHERIQSRGGNPFMEDQVPKAVLRFKQGFGRLIRSTTDTGQVVVLDPRIVTKRYGRVFLDSLPEGVEVHDVQRDFDGIDEPAYED